MPFVLGLPNQASPVTIQEDVNTTQNCTVVTPYFPNSLLTREEFMWEHEEKSIAIIPQKL